MTSCPEAAFDVAFHRWLVAHYRHDANGSKSGKSKGACTGLGQINAAAFNIRPSVHDRDRDGMTILLVGDLDFGTKGQRFVRRRHGVIVERDAAGSFGSSVATSHPRRTQMRHSLRHELECRANKVRARRSTVACVIPNLLRSTRPRRAKIRGIAAKCCCKTPIS